MVLTVTAQIPDNDIIKRRIGQRIDPVSGIIYTKDVYDPEKPPPKPVSYLHSSQMSTATLYLQLKLIHAVNKILIVCDAKCIL
jgi:hypothetical protein